MLGARQLIFALDIKLNCFLRPCFSPEIPTFGLKHIYFIGAFDNAKNSYHVKKVGLLISGFLASSTLNAA